MQNRELLAVDGRGAIPTAWYLWKTLGFQYQRDAGGEGAKRDKAPDGSIYHLDDTSDGVTSGTTDT